MAAGWASVSLLYVLNAPGVHLVENIETVRRACIGLVVIQVGEILSVCIYAHCVCNIQQELVDNIDLASNEI